MRKAITLLIAILICASYAYAMNGCAEKTRTGEWCVYTSEENVEEGKKFTPTACEQTSYCKIGCCYSSDEGRCFRNTPRAACTAEGATWNADAMCSIDQCAKGCCMLGDQAFFVTEVKCKQTASLYPEVAMVFNKDVNTERECVASAKSQEQGCCVQADGCGFTTRANCEVAEDTISGNATSARRAASGFYKDMLCSNDQLNCGCGKQQTTGCVGEDIYWFDTCGNRENIYSSDRRVSYNNGYVMKESESCTGSADDVNCGNCDYTSGNVCGEDKEKKMEVGNSICIGLGCKTTYDDEVSPNADGKSKMNGESWCVYDSMPGLARDLVGSRHYRHLCMNGEEMVEGCKDFREEICVQGVMGEEVLRNVEALQGLFGDEDYIEAACRDNRDENCFACNQYLSDEEEKTGLTPTIIEKRKKCCENEVTKDCYWLPSVIQGGERGVDGTCVPQVPPGLKFWGDKPKSDDSEDSSTPTTPAEQKCVQASSECNVKWSLPGLARLGGFGHAIRWIFLIDPSSGGAERGWTAVVNPQCTKKDWVVAGNNICKAVGDCGAYYNIRGTLTKDGYMNSLVDERDFSIDGRRMKLSNNDIEDWDKLTIRMSNEETSFWSMEQAGDVILFTGITMIGSGLLSSGMAGWTGEGFGLGLLPFSGIGSLFTKDAGLFFAQSLGAEELAAAGISGVPEGFAVEVGKELSEEALTDAIVDGASEQVAEQLLGEGSSAVADAAAEEFLRDTAGNSLKEISAQLTESGFEESVVQEMITQPTIDGSREYAANLIGQEAAVDASRDELIQRGAEARAENIAERAAQQGLVEDGVVQQQTSGFGTFMTVFQTYMWMRTILQFVDIFATDTVDKTYTISCMPWEQPAGGEDCESCNEEMKPCSEYKCKSLGAACTLVNAGTSDEKCVAMDVNDVNSPIIRPWTTILTPPYELEEVTEQGNPGYRIKENIPPFKPITVGITTDEPATCKYDVVPNTKFDNMPGQFGSTLLLYNQSSTFTLPAELAQKNVTAANKGEYAMFIRCKDANDNKNERDYFVKFVIDDSPDLTPPTIKFTSLQNEGYVSSGTESIDFSIYVDEPGECKYSRRDTDFEQMEQSFVCKTSAFGQSSIYFGTYECTTTLKNLTKTANAFFIKCKDKLGFEEKDRNVMSESFKFTLKGSDALNITSVSPEGDLYTKDVTMKVTTVKGAENGKANCGYSNTDVPFGSMIAFATTGESRHEQVFTDMGKGDYTFYISCMDIAGNEAKESTSFKVTVDSDPPALLSVYVDSIFGTLHLEFDEAATCEYTTDRPAFSMGEGTPIATNTTVHEAQISGSVFYVKCKDIFDNKGEYTIYRETGSSYADFFS
ncbi:MAG: hypothetical protein KJ955_00835 [Nanoarchaeota archaeon]|nr:hypothetical protein [Nanoarchaeota archaeon]